MGMGMYAFLFSNVMQVVIVATVCFAATGLIGRILWRVGSRITPGSRAEGFISEDRFHRLETAVDTIAIEVERISEAQRYMMGQLDASNQLRRADRAELPLPNRSAGQVNTPH